MVLVPWRCYEGLSCFAKEMNQLFDRFFGHELMEKPGKGILQPPLQVIDSENEVCVELDIPDFSPEELEIVFKENVLFIKGKKTKDREIKTGEVRYIQKGSDAFTRTIPIQHRVKGEGIYATYKNSRLSICLPKIKRKSATIKVKIR